MRLARFTFVATGMLAAAAACYPHFSFVDKDAGAPPIDAGDGGSATTTMPEPGMVRLGTPGATFEFTLESEEGDRKISAMLTHAFFIDVKEVTARDYRKWLASNDGGVTRPTCDPRCPLDIPEGPYADAGMRWLEDWNTAPTPGPCLKEAPYDYGDSTREWDSEFPVTCVNWYDALAYCAAFGKRLPTEAEWMFAATNGGDGRALPFTTVQDPNDITCNQAIFDRTRKMADGGGCNFPQNVGSTDAGPNGIFDLAGSVKEWMFDVFDPLPPQSQVDHAGRLDVTDTRLLHGGSFTTRTDDNLMLNKRRQAGPPDEGYVDIGFRCAKTAPR